MYMKRSVSLLFGAVLVAACTSVCIQAEAPEYKAVEAVGPECIMIDVSGLLASTVKMSDVRVGVVTAAKSFLEPVAEEPVSGTEPVPQDLTDPAADEVTASADTVPTAEGQADEEFIRDPDWALIEDERVCAQTEEEDFYNRNPGEVEEDEEKVVEAPVIPENNLSSNSLIPSPKKVQSNLTDSDCCSIAEEVVTIKTVFIKTA